MRMRNRSLVVLVPIVLIGAGVAHAGIRPLAAVPSVSEDLTVEYPQGSRDVASERGWLALDAYAGGPQPTARGRSNFLSSGNGEGFAQTMGLRVPDYLDDCDADGEPSVIALPESPSSLRLALSGLATLGVVRLLRGTRKLHFGQLPAWYHAECSPQVGRTRVLDLDLLTAPLPVFEFSQPVADPPVPLGFEGRDRSRRPADQCFLTTAAPRGPPTSR